MQDATLIDTPRLRLTHWSPHDAHDFYHLTGDDGFNAFTISNYTQTDVHAASRWIRDRQLANSREGCGVWPVRRKQDGEMIGIAGLRLLANADGAIEVMYRFRRAAWGCGYATETADALLRHASTKMALTTLVAMADPKNHASRRVLEKIGFLWSHISTYRGAMMNFFIWRASAEPPSPT